MTSVTPNPLPRQLALDQNYPNPFNPTTVIKFSLPKETRITLDVFNVIGQHVVTLFDGVKPAGFYDVTFRSDGLASGIYFYRLTTNEKSFVKKMMLVK